MADGSKIEWTDSTWNIVTGCSVLSPGCTNCYAMRLAGTRLRDHPSRERLTQEVNGNHIWTGEVRLNVEWMTQPIQWTKPRRIFVCAHGDLFHDHVPSGWIDMVFAVMALCPQHIFQVLTKRSGRMRAYLNDPETPQRVAARILELGPEWGVRGEAMFEPLAELEDEHQPEHVTWPLSNVWAGVSAEDQERWDERVSDLSETLATIRWVSAEPLLGLIEPGPFGLAWVDWLVVGGESGPGARPMQPDWARGLRDTALREGARFHFKQWGVWAPKDESPSGDAVRRAESEKSLRVLNAEHGGRVIMERMSKDRAGRTLDGRTWDEFPEVDNVR